MVELKEIKISSALLNEITSNIKTPCSKEAKGLLSDCMVVSAAFLSLYVDHLRNREDKDVEERQVLDDLLLKLRIPKY